MSINVNIASQKCGENSDFYREKTLSKRSHGGRHEIPAGLHGDHWNPLGWVVTPVGPKGVNEETNKNL